MATGTLERNPLKELSSYCIMWRIVPRLEGAGEYTGVRLWVQTSDHKQHWTEGDTVNEAVEDAIIWLLDEAQFRGPTRRPKPKPKPRR